MGMTRAQRLEYRHTLEGVVAAAKMCAKHFDTTALVYRARNGFYMYGREIAYEPRIGDLMIVRVYPDGRTEGLK
jgi:hypothetical protein